MLRRSTAIRVAAWTVLVAGVGSTLLRRCGGGEPERGWRRHLKLHPAAVLVPAAAAPAALCVMRPRTPARDVLTCVLQMWAYLAAYEMPHDDPDALERRVRVRYPVQIDRAIGLGRTPTMRLQRLFGRPGRINRVERVLVWSHWLWFLVPHGTVVYLLLRHRERFPAGAARMYGVFDLGVIAYWVIPTAPPWYAAREGYLDDGRLPELRRMMVEYGEQFWGPRWHPMYRFLGGNPLAAMPSLHFATSVMAAQLLAEIGPRHGAVGWTYALTLGVALVYLGEHYVADLAAGLALAEAVRQLAPRAAGAARTVSAGVQALEARAR